MLMATHFSELVPDSIDERILSFPIVQVLGITGIETYEIIKGTVEKIA